MVGSGAGVDAGYGKRKQHWRQLADWSKVPALIMANAKRRLTTLMGGKELLGGTEFGTGLLCWMLLSGMLLSGGGESAAAEARAGQPRIRMRSSCPLLVPPQDAELQPLRLHPSQVRSKNARGCLSPADAIYAADGCPERLCDKNAGVIQLPPLP